MTRLQKLLCAGAVGAAILAAPAAHAKDIKMLFSFAIPPYVIKDGAEASGFEYDIVKAALAAKGHTIKPVFVAMGAIPKMLKEQQADGAQRGNPDLKEADGFFYAEEPAVTYQDVAITLKKNNIAINSAADLKDKSITTFQGASNFLGPQFAAAVKGNQNYVETSDEKRRVMQLYANGVQVYVGDINVYKYYKAAASGVDTGQEVVIHKIFGQSAQQFNNPVFRDKQIRDDFNAGLKQIKSNGQYKQIVKKYISE
ncbi:MAG TPA: transporter substrate-binding domain-containing protein [Paucimonas sp.]|nr:transporter substrate-binding domain-containing protein [Paucimonas sp.]